MNHNNKKYWMGGGGNGKWGGYSEPAKPTGATGGATPSTGGAVEGYDVGGMPAGSQPSKGGSKGEGGKGEPKGKGEPSGNQREPKREKSEKEKKAEATKKAQANSPEAKAERERKQTLNAMTPQQRADHFASNKMFDRFNKSEWNKSVKQIGEGKTYEKWHGKDNKGGHYAKLKEQWAKGGQKKWMSKNAKSATAIRDKAQREEAYRAGKRGEKIPTFKNKPIKQAKPAKKEGKAKKQKEFKPKTWKSNKVKGRGSTTDFKIHTPTRAKK